MANAEQVDQQPDQTEKSPQQRVWWLLILLLILLNGLAWQRERLGQIVGKMAIKAVSAGEGGAADRWINISQKLAPDNPEAELALARQARHESDFEAARQHLNRARLYGANPDWVDREQWLGVAQSGRISLAEPHLSELLQTAEEDQPEICEAYALGYMRLRNFPPALTLLDAWAGDYPDDPRPPTWIGYIHQELRATKQAEAAFRQALAIDGDHPAAALGLGQLLVDAKQTDEAIPWFYKALADPKLRAKAAVSLAVSLRSQSRVEEANKVLSDALAEFPDDPQLLVEQANSLTEQGEYERAIEFLQPQIDKGTRRRELRYAYAVALRGVGKPEEAVQHFEYATEAAAALSVANRRGDEATTRPNDVQLRFEIGSTQLKYGNIEDGLLWLQGALDIDPRHEATHRVLADYYRERSAGDPKFFGLAQQHAIMAGAPLQPSAEPETAAPIPQPAPTEKDNPSPASQATTSS